MAVLRSCYDVDMRFPGVGVVRVRWFWTEQDFLSLPNVYDSGQWDINDPADRDIDTGEPGEVWNSRRPYRKGQAPDLTGCKEPFGSPAAWLGQSDHDSPLTICGGSFPAAYDREYSDQWDSLTFAEE